MNVEKLSPYLTMSDPATYRIVVRGSIPPSMVACLSGMGVKKTRRDKTGIETTLEGRLADQAALSGVLNTLYELHLPVVSADCLDQPRKRTAHTKKQND